VLKLIRLLCWTSRAA